jgi:hypothetical protein
MLQRACSATDFGVSRLLSMLRLGLRLAPVRYCPFISILLTGHCERLILGVTRDWRLLLLVYPLSVGLRHHLCLTISIFRFLLAGISQYAGYVGLNANIRYCADFSMLVKCCSSALYMLILLALDMEDPWLSGLLTPVNANPSRSILIAAAFLLIPLT